MMMAIKQKCGRMITLVYLQMKWCKAIKACASWWYLHRQVGSKSNTCVGYESEAALESPQKPKARSNYPSIHNLVKSWHKNEHLVSN